MPGTVRLRRCWKASEAVKVVAVFDQPADAIKGVIGQAVNLESFRAIRPTAVQIKTRCGFKAQTTIKRRIAKGDNSGIAKLVQ